MLSVSPVGVPKEPGFDSFGGQIDCVEGSMYDCVKKVGAGVCHIPGHPSAIFSIYIQSPYKLHFRQLLTT
eukprot:10349761-Ditylum_brightwellii.AAC.1